MVKLFRQVLPDGRVPVVKFDRNLAISGAIRAFESQYKHALGPGDLLEIKFGNWYLHAIFFGLLDNFYVLIDQSHGFEDNLAILVQHFHRALFNRLRIITLSNFATSFQVHDLLAFLP